MDFPELPKGPKPIVVTEPTRERYVDNRRTESQLTFLFNHLLGHVPALPHDSLLEDLGVQPQTRYWGGHEAVDDSHFYRFSDGVYPKDFVNLQLTYDHDVKEESVRILDGEYGADFAKKLAEAVVLVDGHLLNHMRSLLSQIPENYVSFLEDRTFEKTLLDNIRTGLSSTAESLGVLTLCQIVGFPDPADLLRAIHDQKILDTFALRIPPGILPQLVQSGASVHIPHPVLNRDSSGTLKLAQAWRTIFRNERIRLNKGLKSSGIFYDDTNTGMGCPVGKLHPQQTNPETGIDKMSALILQAMSLERSEGERSAS